MKKYLLSGMLIAISSMTFAQVVRENEAAIVYYMPKTELMITLDYNMVEEKPGVFYQYAEHYLGATKIIIEENKNYQLVGVKTQVVSSADTNRPFKVVAQKGMNTQLVSLTEDGRLVGYGIENASLQFSERSQGELQNGSKAAYSLEAKSEELMPLMEEQFLAGSVAKMAEGAAKQIYRIRETRLNILAGDVEHVPADGKAMELVLNELDKQEQALVALFVGTTKVTRHTHTLLYTPAESVENEVICRLSAHNGVVDKNDLSGEPIYLTLDASYRTLMPGGYVDKNTPVLSQLYYNLPGEAKMVMQFKGKIVAESHFEVAQYGVAVPLAQELVNSKTTTSIVISPETGNILSIRK